jgi:hypothetical protein
LVAGVSPELDRVRRLGSNWLAYRARRDAMELLKTYARTPAASRPPAWFRGWAPADWNFSPLIRFPDGGD